MPHRVLVVGYGSIGARHVTVIRRLLPSATIGVVRSRGCSGIGDPAVDVCFESVDAAIAFAPDVAVVANAATQHVDAASRLASQGVHLLVEKPISHDLRDVRTLIATALDNRVVLAVGYNLRFVPSLLEFRALLRSGMIGAVYSVRAEAGQYLPSWRPNADYRQTVSARSDLGGGVLLELSHELDYLRWLFGDVQWINAVLRHQSTLDVDVEDTAHLIMGFMPTGNSGQVVATVNLDFIRQDSVRHCTVIGEKGTLRWNAINGTVEVLRAGETDWRTLYSNTQGRDDSYVSQFAHFLQCVSRSSSPLVTAADGLAVLTIIEAARASARRNATVSLDTLDVQSINSAEAS